MSIRELVYTMLLVSLGYVTLQAQNERRTPADSVMTHAIDTVMVTDRTFNLEKMVEDNEGLVNGTGFDMGKAANRLSVGTYSRLPVAYPRIENLPFSMSPVYIYGSRFVNKMHYIDGASTMLDGLIWDMDISPDIGKLPNGAGSDVLIERADDHHSFIGLLGSGDIRANASTYIGPIEGTLGVRIAGPILVKELFEDARVLPTTMDGSGLAILKSDDWDYVIWAQYSHESRDVQNMFGLESLTTKGDDLKSLSELRYKGLGTTALSLSINNEDDRSSVREVFEGGRTNDMDFSNSHTGMTFEVQKIPLPLQTLLGGGAGYHNIDVATDSTSRNSEFAELWAKADAMLWLFDISGSIYGTYSEDGRPKGGYGVQAGFTVSPDSFFISRARLSASYSDLIDRFIVNNRHYTDMVPTTELPMFVEGFRRALQLELNFDNYAMARVRGTNTHSYWVGDAPTKPHQFYGWDFMAAGHLDAISAMLKYSRYFTATVNSKKLPGSLEYMWEAYVAGQFGNWSVNLGYMLHSRLEERDRKTSELATIPAAAYFSVGASVRFESDIGEFYIGLEWQNIEGAFRDHDAVITSVQGNQVIMPSIADFNIKWIIQ